MKQHNLIPQDDSCSFSQALPHPQSSSFTYQQGHVKMLIINLWAINEVAFPLTTWKKNQGEKR